MGYGSPFHVSTGEETHMVLTCWLSWIVAQLSFLTLLQVFLSRIGRIREVNR
jgi:hypothetical protein